MTTAPTETLSLGEAKVRALESSPAEDSFFKDRNKVRFTVRTNGRRQTYLIRNIQVDRPTFVQHLNRSLYHGLIPDFILMGEA